MPPPDDDLHTMGDALVKLNAGLERVRRQTKGAGLLGLLQVIADHDWIRPAAIAERLEVHGSIVSRQVRESEDAGFVSVTHDPSDRRSLLISLKPAGEAELRRLVELGRAQFAGLVDDWEPDQVRTLTRLVERLLTSMAASAARERRSRRRPSARYGGGQPAWFIDWLGG